MRRFAAFMFAALLAVLPAAPAASGPAAPAPHRVQFDYHNSFLLNLHHFLYDSATLGSDGPRAQWLAIQDGADRAALEAAAAYYAATYARSDVFDADMAQVRRARSTPPSGVTSNTPSNATSRTAFRRGPRGWTWCSTRASAAAPTPAARRPCKP
jgi:hypothetical protein